MFTASWLLSRAKWPLLMLHELLQYGGQAPQV